MLRACPDKEAILHALVTHMFTVQFSGARAMLGGEAEPLLVNGVETALQDLYTSAYTLPTTTDFIYRSTARELQQIFGRYLSPCGAERLP